MRQNMCHWHKKKLTSKNTDGSTKHIFLHVCAPFFSPLNAYPSHAPDHYCSFLLLGCLFLFTTPAKHESRRLYHTPLTDWLTGKGLTDSLSLSFPPFKGPSLQMRQDVFSKHMLTIIITTIPTYNHKSAIHTNHTAHNHKDQRHHSA